ncbi:MAG: hypothetical protein V1489_00280 [Candidatus Liptonbacteria bacterium]
MHYDGSGLVAKDVGHEFTLKSRQAALEVYIGGFPPDFLRLMEGVVPHVIRRDGKFLGVRVERDTKEVEFKVASLEAIASSVSGSMIRRAISGLPEETTARGAVGKDAIKDADFVNVSLLGKLCVPASDIEEFLEEIVNRSGAYVLHVGNAEATITDHNLYHEARKLLGLPAEQVAS